MSEFKVGDKVYLECEVSEKDRSDNTYRLKHKDWANEYSTTVFVKNDVLHTTDEFYNKGLEDAWKIAKKIVLPTDKGGYTADEIDNIFGKRTYISVMETFTPQEALAKVKAYEEKCNKIKVGDVVRLKGCSVEGIVTRVTGTNIYRLFKDGSSTKEAFKDVGGFFVKTGKHFDSIDEFMKS